MTLSIPDIGEDQDTLSAALAYARAGWYVLPVDRASKHAGSVVGKGWPAKSSRDVEQIIAWFTATAYALALHVGRSGALAFDVDRPGDMPPLLRAALLMVPSPFQSTRDSAAEAERGHYLYAAPDGRTLGNSAGALGRTWGEVRGKNGIIIVAPSEHEKAAEGGRYAWVRTGALPELPAVLAEQLPDGGDAQDAATDREIRTFLDRHVGNARPELLYGVLTQWATALAAGESRHQAMLRTAAGAMREAAAGLYPALEAATRLLEVWTAAMGQQRDGRERVLAAPRARAEFTGILAWGIAQVAAADLEAVREDVDDRLRDDFSDLLPPGTSQGPPPFDADQSASRVREAGDEEDEADEEIDLQALQFEREVAAEVRKLKIREEAARRTRRARLGDRGRPRMVPLGEFLATPDPPVRHRIQSLWPVGGRVVLAAQYKAGKTTLVGNLIRSLVDSVPFLGKYDPTPFTGKVVLLDDELDEGMVRSWLRDQNITYVDGVVVTSLRGELSTFDILDPETRSEWAADLSAAGASIVILDCLAPILDALGLSEDKEAGRFLVAFDEMLKEAGVSEAVLVHHMGHSGERSRGASRLRDWPDVEWRLVREKSDDGEIDPAAPRYFSAYGRDVDVSESRLTYEPSARRLEISGGSRKDVKAGSAGEAIVDYLTLSPGMSGRQIEDALTGDEHSQKAVRDALKELIRGGRVRRSPGPRNSFLHWINDLVNKETAGQPSALSALILDASISENDHPQKTSASQDQRTETADHSPSALSASPVRQRSEQRVRQCVLLKEDDALTHSSLPLDPRDPSDLLPPNPTKVIRLDDGTLVDTDTGEVLTQEAGP